MADESETEPKGERRVDAKVDEEEKTGEETRRVYKSRGSRGADSETERGIYNLLTACFLFVFLGKIVSFLILY